MDADEAEVFLSELVLTESGFARLAREAYSLLEKEYVFQDSEVTVFLTSA